MPGYGAGAVPGPPRQVRTRVESVIATPARADPATGEEEAT